VPPMPSVQRIMWISSPLLLCFASVPAIPNSTSSGCAPMLAITVFVIVTYLLTFDSI
jgi:hypothetical protein